MKISFYLYSRQPLGRCLGGILAACESAGELSVQQVLLTSRERRADLPREELLRSAACSASDSCEIVTTSGALSLAWLYGPRRNVPRIWGTLSTSVKDLESLKRLLNELCATAGVTYGVCDSEAIRLAAMRSAPDMYGSSGSVSALNAIYWYNYFGPEFGPQLPATAQLKAAFTDLIELKDGFAIVTRATPKAPIDPQRIDAITSEWPVFREYDRKAAFREPVRIDYSPVWGLAAPSTKEEPIGSLVGPARDFIASVEMHTERFKKWALGKGLSARTEQEFFQILRDNEAVIRDELMVPAIAAYGEMVRAKMGGVWKTATVFHRGEPVVAKPGRPWTARRVILEVLEGLDPVEA